VLVFVIVIEARGSFPIPTVKLAIGRLKVERFASSQVRTGLMFAAFKNRITGLKAESCREL